MKILHVIANVAPRYGGPSKACLEMARAQAQLGNEVSVYTTNQDGQGTLDVPTDRPVRWEGVTLRYFPIQFPRFWGTSLPLIHSLKEKIPDVNVVHIHTLYLFHTVAAAFYSLKFRIPYILRPHGILDPYIYRRHRLRKRIAEFLFQDRITRQAAAIHFITEEEKALAEQYTFGTPGFVVPIGLNIDEYSGKLPGEALFSRFPELRGKKIVLFLGRINFKKGLDILAGAFSAVARERNDVHLLIAGPDDDGYGEKVVRWLKEGNVFSKTTFAGMLQGEEKLEAFHNSAVFVLPSYSENFGISILEAMACGLPVIVSDKVNLWPAIVEAKAGEVAPCDAVAFSRKILEILVDEESAQRMGRNGAALVRAKYSWPGIAAQMIAKYASLTPWDRR